MTIFLGIFGKDDSCGCPCREYYVTKCEQTYARQCHVVGYDEVCDSVPVFMSRKVLQTECQKCHRYYETVPVKKWVTECNPVYTEDCHTEYESHCHSDQRCVMVYQTVCTNSYNGYAQQHCQNEPRQHCFPETKCHKNAARSVQKNRNEPHSETWPGLSPCITNSDPRSAGKRSKTMHK